MDAPRFHRTWSGLYLEVSDSDKAPGRESNATHRKSLFCLAQDPPAPPVPERCVRSGPQDHHPRRGDQRSHLHCTHSLPLLCLARWGDEHSPGYEPHTLRLLPQLQVCQISPSEQWQGMSGLLIEEPRGQQPDRIKDDGKGNAYSCVCKIVKAVLPKMKSCLSGRKATAE